MSVRIAIFTSAILLVGCLESKSEKKSSSPAAASGDLVAKGDPGKPGEPGLDGKKGDAGPTGSSGKNGTDGTAGKGCAATKVADGFQITCGDGAPFVLKDGKGCRSEEVSDGVILRCGNDAPIYISGGPTTNNLPSCFDDPGDFVVPKKPMIGAHQPSSYVCSEEAFLDQQFLASFRAGAFDSIGVYTAGFGRIMQARPDAPIARARMGYLSIWQFAERYRLQTVPSNIFDLAGSCFQHFSEASRLAPQNMLFKGFDADCTSLLGAVMPDNPPEQKQALQGLGMFKSGAAIQGLPEFNLFTIAYPMLAQAPDSLQFNQGLEMLFQNLEACSGAPIDRNNPDFSSFIATNPSFAGTKRYCGNTASAPHNFEGFFLAMGDALVKAGKVPAAIVAYKNAKLLPTSYAAWPYKGILERNLANAAAFVQPFQAPVDPFNAPAYPTIMFNTQYSCMGCHQAPPLVP